MATTTILSDNGVSSGTSGVKTVGGTDGTLTLQTANTGGTAINAVYIDNNQKVGIGTNSPAAKLDVSATLRALSSTASAPASGKGVETWYDSSGDFGRIASYDRTGAAYKNQYVDGAELYLNSQSGGNVGVGTNSPSSSYGRLTVAGTGITIAEDGNAKLQIGRYSSGSPYSYIKMSPNSSGLKITNPADNADLLSIDSSGRFTTPSQPAFLVGGSSGASASSLTYIPYSGSISYNVGSCLNTTTGVFTAPVTGMYAFSWILLMQGVTNNVYIDPQYICAGVGYYYGPRAAATAPNTEGDGYFCVTGSVVRKLVAGDTFSVGSSVSSGTFNFYNNSSWTHYMGMLIS